MPKGVNGKLDCRVVHLRCMYNNACIIILDAIVTFKINYCIDKMQTDTSLHNYKQNIN